MSENNSLNKDYKWYASLLVGCFVIEILQFYMVKATPFFLINFFYDIIPDFVSYNKFILILRFLEIAYTAIFSTLFGFMMYLIFVKKIHKITFKSSFVVAIPFLVVIATIFYFVFLVFVLNINFSYSNFFTKLIMNIIIIPLCVVTTLWLLLGDKNKLKEDAIIIAPSKNEKENEFMFCRKCGQQILEEAVICVHCGVSTGKSMSTGVNPGAKTRLTYILLGIFLGGFGIHNFYAGYTRKAVAQLLISIFTGWLIVPLIGIFIWVIVEICTVTHDSQGNILS